MKIENNSITPLASNKPDNVERVDAAARKQAQHVNRVGGHDKAEVSESARLLSKARANLDGIPEEDSERVNLLRQQVQSGDYTVQVEHIANRLLRQFRR
jgi:flagellar biosynthesis anti-sigma factor FlgM